jgi:hypothetical protein
MQAQEMDADLIVMATHGRTGVSHSATLNAPDLTDYFLNSATGCPLTPGNERNLSQAGQRHAQVSDPQCASGWPCGADNFNDANGCPMGTPQLQGVCMNNQGGGSFNFCTPGGACPQGENCQLAGPGCPKYGDYNGNACIRGGVYTAWASATSPAGLFNPPAGVVNIYTDRFNNALCGQQNQACCFQGSQCSGETLACDSLVNTCVACGTHEQVTKPLHLAGNLHIEVHWSCSP